MKRGALFTALGLLIFVNLLVLLGVARNRGGEPEARLTLTERELPLSWFYRKEENSGVSLHLEVHFDREEMTWFDEEKLAELGFDIRPYDPSKPWETYKTLPKRAWVVLEYDGAAWQQYRRRMLEEIEEIAEKVRQGKLEPEKAEKQEEEKRFRLSVASHLFAVDAGSDAEALRLRHADRGRYLILPAKVRLGWIWEKNAAGDKKVRRLRGWVQEILTDELHVPRKLQHGLLAMPEKTRIQPGYTYFNRKNPARVGYRVRIAVGRRYEPWIEEIEILKPK